ncbi:MAG: carbamoyltransferase C-terminal domain-containing protein [Planctomycetota bacterium]
MRVIGFNSTHDCGAALVEDGRIRFAIEEERLTRVKHQGGFPTRSLAACAEAAGCPLSEIEAAADYWNPWKGLWRFGWHFLRSLPGSITHVRRQPGIWRSMLALEGRLRRETGFRGRFHFVDHHLAHAASTFYPSAFEEAAIMTLDGTGEWATTLFGVGRGRDIEVKGQVDYPHSLGKVYEAVTQYLGFRPMSGEGKVMGLAPYGEPRFLEDFRRIVVSDGPLSYRVDQDYFQYQLGRERKWSDRFAAHFGPPREAESEIEDRHRDLAASLQARLEEVALELARELRARTGQRRLCLAGGVAFNSVMNGRLLRDSGFEDVFVTPAANDAGAGLGAALWAARHHHDEDVRHPWPGTGLGPDIDPEEARAACVRRGLSPTRPEALAEAVASRIAAGRVIGWCRGRMEYGPRALGQRSILADPRAAAMKDHVNARVKHREGFRPFAPAVLVERAEEWFEGVRPTPYMLEVFPVRPERRERVAAITHVDGSARVQTVGEESEPVFRELVRAFDRLTGVPMVMNTSFNVRGQPIVCRADDAVATFLETGIDTLVLGDLLIDKEDAA